MTKEKATFNAGLKACSTQNQNAGSNAGLKACSTQLLHRLELKFFHKSRLCSDSFGLTPGWMGDNSLLKRIKLQANSFVGLRKKEQQ
jgi:hypothetical protein